MLHKNNRSSTINQIKQIESLMNYLVDTLKKIELSKPVNHRKIKKLMLQHQLLVKERNRLANGIGY